MRTEYRHDDVDKTAWGEGPWVDEPDKVVWVDEATNLDCMIHRNRVGALCGYVGVGPDHPWHGKHYDECDVMVHGGLTYSDKCQETATEDNGICHVPAPGREHDIWWLGFDCAHGQDVCPAYESTMKATGFPLTAFERGVWGPPSYKDIEYVTAEVTALAAQVAQA